MEQYQKDSIMKETQLTSVEETLHARFEVEKTLSPGVFDELDEETILKDCNSWIDGGDPNNPHNWRYFSIAGFFSVIGHDTPRVLDVGCGIGWPTFILAPFCTEIIGIDYSEKMIRVASRLLEERFHYDNVRFVCADMSTFCPSSDEFDVIVSDNSLDLSEDPLKQLKNLKHLLKPGGYLVADFYNILYKLGQKDLVEETGFHKNHFRYSVWDRNTFECRVYLCSCDSDVSVETENREGPPSEDELEMVTSVSHYTEKHFDAGSLRKLLIDARFSEYDFYITPEGWRRAISEFKEYRVMETLAQKRFEIMASIFKLVQPTDNPHAHFVVAKTK